MPRTCYMCENRANSVEHVPPKCLFPAKKDLPRGINLRKDLITVPSCHEHNTKKSKDDEYLLYCLVMSIPSNQIGKNLFLKKIMRSVKRNPALIKQFLTGHKNVFVEDMETLEVNQTIACQIDVDRIEGEIEHLSRAVYYHHFGDKWLGKVSVYPNFLLSMDTGYHETNALIENMDKMSNELFSKEQFFGKNQGVFKYNAVDMGKGKQKIMRFYFYNGNRVTVIFGVNG